MQLAVLHPRLEPHENPWQPLQVSLHLRHHVLLKTSQRRFLLSMVRLLVSQLLQDLAQVLASLPLPPTQQRRLLALQLLHGVCLLLIHPLTTY